MKFDELVKYVNTAYESTEFIGIIYESFKMKEWSLKALTTANIKNANTIVDKMIDYDTSKNNKNVLHFIQCMIKYRPGEIDNILDLFKSFSTGPNKNVNLHNISRDKFYSITPSLGVSKNTKQYDDIVELLTTEEQQYAKFLSSILAASVNKSITDLVAYFRMLRRMQNGKDISSFNTFEELEQYVDTNQKSSGVAMTAGEKIRYVEECIYKDNEVLIWSADTQEKAIKYARQAQPNSWCISREMWSGSNLYNGYRLKYGATFYFVKHLPIGEEVSIKGSEQNYSDMMVHVYGEDAPQGARVEYTGKPNGDKSVPNVNELGKIFPFLNKTKIKSLFKVRDLNEEEKRIAKIMDLKFNQLTTEEEQFRYAELGNLISDDELELLIQEKKISVISAYIGCGVYNLSQKIINKLPISLRNNYVRVFETQCKIITDMIEKEYAHLIVDE